jgi:Tfp pilus assembly PilM family ATPase
MATTTLGIDIGWHSVRGALVRSTLRTLTVERYVEVNLQPLTPDATQEQIIHAALRELMHELGEPPDVVIMAIDGTRASLRVVEIPLAAKKRIADVLPFELESVLPFAVDEAVIDYQDVNVRGTNLAVLAAAVPDLAVSEFLEDVALAGLHPRELAVGGAALDGLLHFIAAAEETGTMLLHLDKHATEVCIVRGKSCELARTLNEGAGGALERPYQFRNALHQTLMKYRSEGGPAVERVVVMGEDAHNPELLQRISEALGLQVEVVSLPGIGESEMTPSPIFGKALGLAARSLRRGKRLDLRKGKFALPRGVSQLRDHAVLASVGALAVVLSYTFSVWAEYRALSEERDALAERLGKVTETHFAESTKSPTRARELLEGGGQSKDPLPRFDAFRALGAISAAFPDNIKHDTRKLEITLDEGGQTGTFALQGQIPDLSARDQVVDALDGHDCIEQLERGKTSTVPGATDRKNYTLEGLIACPGAKRTKGAKKTGK